MQYRIDCILEVKIAIRTSHAFTRRIVEPGDRLDSVIRAFADDDDDEG